MTTRLGRTVRATANHEFFTIRGWRRLDELSHDDRIALPRRLPGPTQATMSDPELGLLGHLIGDGCTLPRHIVQYTTKDLDLAETVVDLARSMFGTAVAPRIKSERSWYQVYLPASERLTHGKRNPIAAWLDELGRLGLALVRKTRARQDVPATGRPDRDVLASPLGDRWLCESQTSGRLCRSRCITLRRDR